MNCKKCGNTIPENSAFCLYCGTPADANTSMESANQQAVYQQQPVYQQQQPVYQQQQPVYQQKPVYGQPYNPAQKKEQGTTYNCFISDTSSYYHCRGTFICF